MLYEQIQQDIKSAMLSKDVITRDCLRTVVSDIKNQTVNAGKEITDSICLNVIKKSIKTHNDSIEQFSAAGRTELAEKERSELNVLSKYVPKMLSEESMQTLVLSVITENNIEETKKNMGTIMKHLNQLPEKDLIDKKYVSQYLNTLLK